MDEPRSMGLQPKVQNLVILAFAAQADRTFVRNGAPIQASLDRIADTAELREAWRCPTKPAWTKARERAWALFGVAPGEVRKGATVAQLAADLKAKAGEKRGQLAELLRELRPRVEGLRVPPTAPRLATIRSAQALVSDLANASNPVATVEVSAGCAYAGDQRSSGVAPDGRCPRLMRGCHGGIVRTSSRRRWALPTTVRRPRPCAKNSAKCWRRNEHALALKPALRDFQARATRPAGGYGDQHRTQPASTATASATTSADSE